MKNINNNSIKLCIFLLLIICSMITTAKVKLPTILSDGMVLQREKPIKIWGTAEPGEVIVAKFLNKTYQTTANSGGDWQITLSPLGAGGPYSLQLNDIILNDILVGDVFLCSGQSNMELPVRRVTDMFQDEIDSYQNNNIRHIKVPNKYDFNLAQSDIDSCKWLAVNQDEVMSYSALAYFFAKTLHAKTNVPIGIINASWGGTPVESWMSEDAISAYPKYLHDKWRYEDNEYVQNIKKLEGENYYHWNTSLYKGDKGLHAQPMWYDNSLDDSDWQQVDLYSDSWGSNGLNPINGSHWFRKTIEVPQSWDQKEATLRLGCIVDADSVYINGKFVGTTSYQYPPRIYKVPAGILKAGANTVTVRLISNNGNPHFVKDKPYKLICDNDEISLEANWKYQLGCEMPQSPSTTFFNYKPVGLYNAMIAPLKNCSFKGVVWYQGESNVSNRNEYCNLLTAMITDWRNTFSDNYLPFYIIELADFLHHDDPGRKAWAEFREVQAQVAKQNYNTTLIKNSDLGEWNDIHPLDKKTLGQRVADNVWSDMLQTNKANR